MAHYRNVATREPLDRELTRPSTPVIDYSNDELVDLYHSHDNAIISGNKAYNGYGPPPGQSRSRFCGGKRKRIWMAVVLVVLIVAAAVAIPVALTTRNKASSVSQANSGVKGGGGKGSSGPISGASGSQVLLDDGTSVPYVNEFGGQWYADPKEPFKSGGLAQSWSKRIAEEEWVWGTDIARGVNLGGWLVTEPFICPALYEKYLTNEHGINVVDEWTLSQAMGDKLAEEMENHYKTFITEQDFIDIAAAGLNWVRIPVGFWVIETINDEPFLMGTSWTYFLKAVQWGRKYGIRIFLDLHSLPGSQNGWNHSGKSGSLNFMSGVMGIANAQRTLTYLRILIEFVSQEQYRDVVGVVGLVNEIFWETVGKDPVQSFYQIAYSTIRKATGTGAGKGPYIAIHEGFQGPAIWEGFLTGADRLALDQHPYLAFMNDFSGPDAMAAKPCGWAIATNQSSKVFGVTLGGEFSVAHNNCGLWLNGIGPNPPAEANCGKWDDWQNYSDADVASLKKIALGTMDALQNFFFWTWKIGNSTVLNTNSCPMWHYKLGVERGWIPKDPREAIGYCASVLGSSQLFDGQYPATATGGAGAGVLAPEQTQLHPFPPTSLSPSFTDPAAVNALPTYTPTGTIKTLFAATFTAAPNAVVGIGWTNMEDQDLAYVPVQGCTYPNPWDAVSAAVPPPCTGS